MNSMIAGHAPVMKEEKDNGPKSAYTRFTSWCRSIGVTKFEDIFLPSITHTECSVCSEVVSEPHAVVVHLCMLKPTDKPRVHGYGSTEKEARDDACAKAVELLETLEPEIFTLRRKRLRVRLEDLGVTLPKTENMLLLEGEKEAGMDGLPQPFIDLVSALTPQDEAEDDEDASFRIDLNTVEKLSSQFLFAIPNMTTELVELVFNKIGLSLCDEMNVGMNPTLFAALISLALRLPLNSLGFDEKLKLSFSKVMEQVVILNAERYPGYQRVVARLIRYLAAHKGLPFMSKNRIESIGTQWSLGGVGAMKIADVEFLAKTNEEALHFVVQHKTPPKEYLDSLFSEFAKINIVIRELFGIDGSIYGSLVNGFPTSSSDIDVVINLPQSAEEIDSENDVPEEDSVASKKGLDELNKLHHAIKERYGEEFAVSKIESARVPILIVKKGEKVEINISFNHEVVIHNSALLRAYSSISPRVRELVVLVKHWAKRREINDALQGSLSSYSYVLLVVAFLQQNGLLPDLQNPPESLFPTRPLPERITDNGRCSTWFLEDGYEGFSYAHSFKHYADKLSKKSLTTLLVEFFEFYLYDVNFVTDVVAVSRVIRHRTVGSLESEFGQKFVKKLQFFRNRDNPELLDVHGLRKRAWLTIADPFEIGRVLGVSGRGMEMITKEMKRGIEILLDGKAGELFDEYSRRERIQLPPFPARKLDRKDFMEYVHPVALRMEFKLDDGEPLNRLISSLSGGEKAGLMAADLNVFSMLCYMSKLGVPTVRQLESIGLMEGGRFVLKPVNVNNQSKPVHQGKVFHKDKKPKHPQESNKISEVRNELLSQHPDSRFQPTEAGKGKGRKGKGKGKGKGEPRVKAPEVFQAPPPPAPKMAGRQIGTL
jgi:hypothetical protein